MPRRVPSPEDDSRFSGTNSSSSASWSPGRNSSRSSCWSPRCLTRRREEVECRASSRDWGGRIVAIGSTAESGYRLLACGVAFGGLAGHAAAQGQSAPALRDHRRRAPDPARPGAWRPRPGVGSTTVVVTTVSAPTPATSTPSVSARTLVFPGQQTCQDAHASAARRLPRATRRRATVAVADVLGGAGRAVRNCARLPSPRARASLLLFAGLALVLLMIGETTFLGARRALRSRHVGGGRGAARAILPGSAAR